jgi:epidermal growth factor receptor substrate 15
MFSSPPIASKSPAPAGNPPVPAKTAFGDDFDKEFGDLAEAKEADDKADENDFGTNSAFGDFDPVFDVASPRGNVAPGTAVTDDGFTDFDFNIDSPAGQQQQQEVKTASSQDWDAIFADLDTKEPAQGQPPRTQTNGNVGGEASGDARQQSERVR